MNQTSPNQEIIDKINSSTNILVTVSDSPSVDALSAAIGLTLALDNMGKYATAIFSGQVPPAITFLDPSKTLESTTDSLRDFIISLDKEKADHLRYKVEGDQVKIFITPYKTTINQNDLNFSLGDYNVELVIALGVEKQENIDKAIDGHGKIFHDATIVSLCSGTQVSNVGSVNWQEPAISSLSEMVTVLSESLSAGKQIVDKQAATALLTGIVAETDRFANEKTTSQSMTIAAKLMAYGADQQLVAAQLEQEHAISPNTTLQVANQEIVQPVDPSLSELENAVQGLIIEHPPKTLEELSKEIKTDDIREDVTALEAPPVEPVVQESISSPHELTIEPLNPPVEPVASNGYLQTPGQTPPINGAVSSQTYEQPIDIFANPQTPVASSSTASAPTINPSAALEAVHAAFNEPTTPVSAPISAPQVDLPLPPPLPDFSKLPTSESAEPLILGSEHSLNNDASQFKIPGQ